MARKNDFLIYTTRSGNRIKVNGNKSLDDIGNQMERIYQLRWNNERKLKKNVADAIGELDSMTNGDGEKVGWRGSKKLNSNTSDLEKYYSLNTQKQYQVLNNRMQLYKNGGNFRALVVG